MNPHEELINRFYTSFQNKDYSVMQSCYADNALFNDPVFVNLNSAQVKAMWEMLCKAGKDLRIEFTNVKTEGNTGSAEWTAWYTFSATGKKVVNKIKANFVFENGKIVKHTDDFSFYNWAKQSLGASGLVLGWTPFVKNKVRKQAMKISPNLWLKITNMLVPNFDPFPVLTTDRLVLKKITYDDVNELFALRSSETVMKYIDRPLHKTIEDTIKQIDHITNLLNTNEGINWGITLKGDANLIGTVCLFNFKKDDYRGELGYILAPQFHRKGIMYEAIQAVIKYGFAAIKLHTIEAQINPHNIASAKVLEKNNFVKEAHFKDYYLTKNGYIDMAFYGLLTPFK